MQIIRSLDKLHHPFIRPKKADPSREKPQTTLVCWCGPIFIRCVALVRWYTGEIKNPDSDVNRSQLGVVSHMFPSARTCIKAGENDLECHVWKLLFVFFKRNVSSYPMSSFWTTSPTTCVDSGTIGLPSCTGRGRKFIDMSLFQALHFHFLYFWSVDARKHTLDTDK